MGREDGFSPGDSFKEIVRIYPLNQIQDECSTRHHGFLRIKRLELIRRPEMLNMFDRRSVLFWVGNTVPSQQTFEMGPDLVSVSLLEDLASRNL